ncbi:hypothetical protein JHN59_16085 [Streptomyces sp. MBT49]|nr:hypothetical protein [Streptomyces sp. MBT49]MBK3626337.1 hypothetical protein [Streptomyces sp. MBT49]
MSLRFLVWRRKLRRQTSATASHPELLVDDRQAHLSDRYGVQVELTRSK